MTSVLGKTTPAEDAGKPSSLAFARSVSVRVEAAHSLLLHGFLRHLVPMGDALDGHAMARCLELGGEKGCK
jgi:hypothetical protein